MITPTHFFRQADTTNECIRELYESKCCHLPVIKVKISKVYLRLKARYLKFIVIKAEVSKVYLN